MPSRISSSVGSGFSLKQPGGLHDHPRGAEAALEAVLVPERLLERMERGAAGHALDRLDLAPSAWTASIVHDLALSPSTWTVQAPQLLVSQPMWVPVRPNDVAQEVDEEEARLDVRLAGLAVDGDA